MARKRPPPRTVQVIRKQLVSPNMLRVTIGGPGLDGFPDDPDGGYIKLHMSLDESDGDLKPAIRTYTIRRFDASREELDVDFVLHEVQGPAASWARNCQPGDSIRFGGPGPRKSVNMAADWFLIVGDMSALPAISANLENMPDDAKGYVLLEIIDQQDCQDLVAPKTLDLRWIVNPHPDQPNSVLLDAVMDIEWLEGEPSVWVAGEFSSALAIRKFLKEERGVSRQQLYASSYWQMGKSEDEHRVSKASAREE